MFVAFAPAFVHPFLDAQTKADPNRAGFWGAVVVRSQRIYGGANEVMLELVARSFLGRED